MIWLLRFIIKKISYKTTQSISHPALKSSPSKNRPLNLEPSHLRAPYKAQGVTKRPFFFILLIVGALFLRTSAHKTSVCNAGHRIYYSNPHTELSGRGFTGNCKLSKLHLFFVIFLFSSHFFFFIRRRKETCGTMRN